jgi:hypothetical protein
MASTEGLKVMKRYVPLVGMRYRRPALAFTTNLKAGHPLLLEKEPLNEYDPLAIAVKLDQQSLFDEQKQLLKGPLSAFGCSLEELPRFIHLGYIARTETEAVHSAWPVTAEFALNAAGYPAVAFEPDFTEELQEDESKEELEE